MLHHTGDGWGAYSYRWNEAQTDAELVPTEGTDELLKVKDAAVPGGVRLQPWRFSSRAECLRCHNTWCGTALGFQPEQLGSQMNELAELKLIASKPKEGKKQLVSPYDPNQDLNARARSYLHINCSHCHRDNAGGSVPSVLNHELPLDKMRSVNARAVLGDLGLVDGKVIAPGKPFSSVLLFRTSATGRTRMPYIGTELVDEEGAGLLREWIASLDEKSSNKSLDVMKDIREPGGVAKHTANSSAALRLAHALAEPSVPVMVKEQVAREARKSSNPLIAELFERFLPAEARANVLQPTARPEEVLALSGDAKRGAALLNDSARTSCLQCHQYGNAGRAFGPSFASIKKTKEEVLGSILQPSREVAPEYVLYTVETGDDEVLSGMIVKRGKDELVVRDATGTDHTLPAAKVTTSRPQQLSAMPEGLLAGLSAQEVADLIAAIIAEAKQ